MAAGARGGHGPSTCCAICVGDWVYTFDVCRNIAVPQALGCSPNMRASMVRLDEYSVPTSRECQLMGPDVEGAGLLLVSALTGAEEGLELTYSHLQRTARLSLICDAATVGSVPQRLEMGGDVIQAVWRTPAGCAGGIVGWLIVTFLVAASAVYVGAGIGWAKYTDKSVPLAEAHPHTEYWKMVPGLVSDGVTFSKAVMCTRGSPDHLRSLTEKPLPTRDSPPKIPRVKDKKAKDKKSKKDCSSKKPRLSKPRPPIPDDELELRSASVSQRALDIDSRTGAAGRE